MKKHLLCSLALLATLSVSARQLTSDEALSRALREGGIANSPSRGSALTLAYTDSDDASGTTGLYVFNRGMDNGFLVVSADDNVPALLGYTDDGRFDSSDIAPNLKAWLNEYTRQIVWASSHPDANINSAPVRPPRAAIAPMCATKWNQDAPYSNLCPTTGGVTCPTGCVATAMAQVMKYHNYPTKGIGSHTYTTATLETELSFDFGNTTFDWANMLDTYTSSATTAQNNAVATLMYACGVSVDMNYAKDASGASSFKVGQALIDYFGYDKGVAYVSRDWYTETAWDELMYTNLSTYGPIVFGGRSTSGGHEFVCDGYNTDGYYHINWGWGGLSDGYFLLSALNPVEQGIGGSDGAYTFFLDAIINIRPANGSTPYVVTFCSSYDVTGSAAATNVLKLSGGFYNYSYTSLQSLTLGVEINGKYYGNAVSDTPTLPYTGASSYTVDLTDLPAGTYTAHPAFKTASSDWQLMTVSNSTVSAVTFTKSTSGAITVSKNANAVALSATDVKVTQLVLGNAYTITAKLLNSGNSDYYGRFYFRIENSTKSFELGSYSYDIQAGKSIQLEYTGSYLPNNVPAGDYTLYIYRQVNFSSTNFEAISTGLPVTVREYEIPAPKTTSFSVANADAVDPEDITVNATIVNTGGYFYGNIYAYIYSLSGINSLDYFMSPLVELPVSSTATTCTFSGTYPGATPGEQYRLYLYCFNNNGDYIQISDTPAIFTIAAQSGIDEIGSGADDVTAVDIYSTAGVRLATFANADEAMSATLQPGIYIMVSTHSDGHHTTKKIIRK